MGGGFDTPARFHTGINAPAAPPALNRLTTPMRFILFTFVLLLASLKPLYSAEVDQVLVIKSEQKLYLLSGGKRLYEYRVALGANPVGHKQQEGDERTPEGNYVLDYKLSDSAFHKAIHISYPNEIDKANALAKGVDPGGLIMIHGQKNGLGMLAWISQRFNWTNGCIAVTNDEMDEIWGLVKSGTPIEIRP
jgi:murein L,D-transpeptidase YafK